MTDERRSSCYRESRRWQGIDATGEPDGFIDYLDQAAVQLRELNQELIRSLEVTPGCSVLDVGCGTGDMLIGLATSVEGVKGVGIDASESMIATARSRAEPGGLPLSFAVGDVERLELPDGSFDRVVCSRVLLHLERPAAAVAEMSRVLAPGGRVAIFEPDLDAVLIDSDDLQIARAVRSQFAGRVRNPDIGRRLRRLLLDAGLSDVEVVPHVGVSTSLAHVTQQFGLLEHLEAAVAAGAVAPEAADAWRAWVEAADASQRFWFSLVAFRATARKPGGQ